MNEASLPRIYLYKQIVEAKLYIDANFREDISLESIASQACFSKFHFHRTFKECYNKTPLKYLTYLRLHEAKLALSKGISTKEVCYSVGFKSVSSFIKLFKKNTHMTPSAYAKMKINQKEKTTLQPLHYIPSDFAEYLGWKSG